MCQAAILYIRVTGPVVSRMHGRLRKNGKARKGTPIVYGRRLMTAVRPVLESRKPFTEDPGIPNRALEEKGTAERRKSSEIMRPLTGTFGDLRISNGPIPSLLTRRTAET